MVLYGNRENQARYLSFTNLIVRSMPDTCACAMAKNNKIPIICKLSLHCSNSLSEYIFTTVNPASLYNLMVLFNAFNKLVLFRSFNASIVRNNIFFDRVINIGTSF